MNNLEISLRVIKAYELEDASYEEFVGRWEKLIAEHGHASIAYQPSKSEERKHEIDNKTEILLAKAAERNKAALNKLSRG